MAKNYTRKNNPQGAAAASAAKAAAGSVQKANAPKMPRTQRAARMFAWLIPVVFFFALWMTMGDIFQRAQLESYVAPSAEAMKHVLDQSFGALHVAGRWGLLIFHWPWLGCALLTGIFALTVWFFAHLLPKGTWWSVFFWMVPVAEMVFMFMRGSNLYYKNEPAYILLGPLAVMLVGALFALLGLWFNRHAKKPEPTAPYWKWRVVANAAMLLCIVMAFSAGRYWNENAILTARMQNRLDVHDFEGMKADALSARRPSRAVAAYYAIACEYTGTLLDEIFAIPYDFPDLMLDLKDGNEEYGLFDADAELYCGLLDAATRCSMDKIVMFGPNTSAFRRMALCAMLNGEEALCRRYLNALSHEPLNGDFIAEIEQYLPCDSAKLGGDMVYAHMQQLFPLERKFEQNYERPTFLGYNLGLGEGSNSTLLTSMATCLYRKDLNVMLPRAEIMAQKGMTLPTYVQQALAILSLKRDELRQFPGLQPYVLDQLRQFLMDAKPYFEDLKKARARAGQPSTSAIVANNQKEDPLVRENRLRVRRELKDRWLGTYFYYYYCENNDPEQIVRPDTSGSNAAGVN